MEINYLYIPIELFQRIMDDEITILDCSNRDKRLELMRLYEKCILSSNIRFSLTDKQMNELKTMAGGKLLALLCYLALKSICGNKKNKEIQTNNNMMISRMAGFRNWGDFEKTEAGKFFNEYKTMNERTKRRRCKTIREMTEKKYKKLKLVPKKKQRGFTFIIIENNKN